MTTEIGDTNPANHRPHNIDHGRLTPALADDITCLFAKLGIAPFSPR
jgi:hypothetical protein